jgi:hypothetical protein
MTLTDMQIKKANKGEKIIKLSDGGGLQLWIVPTGGSVPGRGVGGRARSPRRSAARGRG